jgi:hypothetical protein
MRLLRTNNAGVSDVLMVTFAGIVRPITGPPANPPLPQRSQALFWAGTLNAGDKVTHAPTLAEECGPLSALDGIRSRAISGNCSCGCHSSCVLLFGACLCYRTQIVPQITISGTATSSQNVYSDREFFFWPKLFRSQNYVSSLLFFCEFPHLFVFVWLSVVVLFC